MKPSIAIILNEDDGQIDIEVYNWDEQKQKKTIFIEKESHYGIETKAEANQLINALYEKFEVEKIISLEEEEEEWEEFSTAPLPTLTPKYITYEYEEEELLSYIKNWFYQQYGVKVPFYFLFLDDIDEDKLILCVDEEELTEQTKLMLEKATEYDRTIQWYNFSNEILPLIFNSEEIHHRKDPEEGLAIIYVPITSI